MNNITALITPFNDDLKIDYKKLKRQPNDWQKFILEKWNELLHPLADKNGWIKIVIWW